MTLAVALCGFLAGSVVGTLVAWAKLVAQSVGAQPRRTATPPSCAAFPIFSSSTCSISAAAPRSAPSAACSAPKASSACRLSSTGALAIGIVSGAYQAEVFRGAYQIVNRGELEAARSVGMHRWLMFRRIIAPQVLRYAIPGLGNTWQLVLKESALISVTGLVELLRQSHIAAGSTRRPFDFYITAAVLYLLITWVSTYLFQRAETHSMRGIRRAS